MSGGQGNTYSKQQQVQVALFHGDHQELLVDPITGRTSFQIDMHLASL
jgi:hypothetical protein